MIYFDLANPTFDLIMPVITDLHKIKEFIIPIVILFVVLFIFKYKRQGLTYFIFLLLSLSLNDFIGAQVKHAVQRERPFQNTELNVVQKSPAHEGKSFYSNHASNMFCLAAYTGSFFPPAKLVLIPFAALVAYSRVYNGVHYPSDVLFGSFMGFLIGSLIAYFVKNKMPVYIKKQAEKITGDES